MKSGGGVGRGEASSVLGHLSVMRPEADRVLQSFVDEARVAFGVGLCVVHLVLDGAQDLAAWSERVPEDLFGVDQGPRESAMFRVVMETARPLVVADLLEDEKFRDGYYSTEYGFRSYAGAPMVSGGRVVGCLCMFDSEPASFTEDDIELLAGFGRAVVARLELLGGMAKHRAGRKCPGSPGKSQSFAVSPDVVLTVELDGSIGSVDRAGASMLGYAPEELVGRVLVDLAHPQDRDALAATASSAAFGRAVSGARGRCLRADGAAIDVEWSAALLPEEGVVRYTVRPVDDGALGRLDAPRPGGDHLVEGGVFGLDTLGKVTFVDDATVRLTGWKAGELIGRRMHDLIHHHRADGTGYPSEECPIYGALEDGNVHRGVDELFWRQNGTSFPIDYVSTPIREGSVVVGAVVRFEDAAGRQRMEEELERREARSRAALESVPDLVLRISRDGEYLDVLANEPGKLYAPREGLIGRNARDVLPEEAAEGLLRKVALALDTGEMIDYEYVPDGSLTFEARLVASGPDEVLCITRDVTVRRKIEGELRGAHQKLASHVENSPLGVIEWGRDAEVLRWSGEAEKMFGWGAQEVLGMRLFEDLRLIHEDDLDVVAETSRRLVAGEHRLVTRNRNYREDGSVIHCEWYNSVLVDEDGELVSVLSLVLDVTEGVRAEEDRRETEEKLRHLTDVALEGIIISKGGRVLEANRAARAMLGYDEPREIIGMSVLDLTAPESVDLVRQKVSSGDEEPYEAVGLRKDGSTFIKEIRGRAYAYLGSEVRVAAVRDVTETRAAEEALRKSKERYKDILRQIEDGYFEVDLHGNFLFANGSMCRILGYPEEELLGANNRKFMDDETSRRVYEHFNRVYRTGEPISSFDWELVRGDGERRYAETSVSLIQDEGGEPVGFRGILRDVTERKLMEEEIAHQAFHDKLTGLPNRTLLQDRLGHALERAGRRRDAAAVLFLDLDNFKYVNDSLGHEAGDALLIEVAARLKRCLRDGDTVARLGGDEFCVLLEDVEAPLDAILVAERIAEEFADPFALKEQEVFVSASLGISLGSSSEACRDLPEELLRDADAAMYAAKAKGKARYEVFTQSMKTRFSERLELETRLRGAAQRGEFRVHYQPKILVETGEIVGFEALIRWQRPGGDLIPPGRFIPIAEETGLIVPIGGWVLRQACRQARSWQVLRAAYGPPLPVCVNLSARQFEDPGLVDDVARTLRETGLEARYLTLEITESALMEDAQSSVGTLEALKALGVKLAIDDFGTGYSSLSYLKRFPADYLKIDRSFVDGLGQDDNDTVLVSGMSGLAHALGLEVIAEGVETVEQLAKLREIGCDLAQGYFISRPVPANQASTLLGI